MRFSRNGFNRILSTGFLVVSSFFAHDALGADSVQGTAIYRERIKSSAREALALAGLLETYWRPVEIAGKSVTLAPDQREPHFVLTADGNRVHGSTGCNRITGSFEESTDGLRFKGLATTRMMCPPPIAELEVAFLKALNATTSHRIIGDSLELLDALGALLMRLEAIYLR